MILDYLIRVLQLISLAALWLLSAGVLAGMLFFAHSAFVDPHPTKNDDWAYAFSMFAGGMWLFGAFGRISWTAVALRDGFATYSDVVKLIAARFAAGALISLCAAAGVMANRWLDHAPSRLALQSSFIAGAIAGLGFGPVVATIHQWRVRESFEKR